MLTDPTVVITSQYTHTSNRYVVHLKLTPYVNYISIAEEKNTQSVPNIKVNSMNYHQANICNSGAQLRTANMPRLRCPALASPHSNLS